MPLALTCDCGARFEVDDLLAGKDIPCPDCAEPIRAPEQAAPPRLSLWALASVVLALAGAFTLVGTAGAILAGLWALVVIRRQHDRLAGSAVALVGIVLGVVFSLLTLAVLARPELFPVASWLRQRSLAGQVDNSGSLEMLSRSGDVLITRPSQDWGRARNDRTDDPVVGEIQQKRDLLLVEASRHAYVDVFRDAGNNNVGLDNYATILVQDLNPPRVPLLGDEDNPRFAGTAQPGGWPPGMAPPTVIGPFDLDLSGFTRLDPVDGHEAREWVYEQKRGGQTWIFIVRAYRKSNPRLTDPIHVVRAYTPKRRFQQNEAELRLLLDSVRIPQ